LAKESANQIFVITDTVADLNKLKFRRALRRFIKRGHVKIIQNADLYQWVWYNKHADKVVTDVYRATLLAAIYKRDFCLITKNSNADSETKSMDKKLEGVADSAESPDVVAIKENYRNKIARKSQASQVEYNREIRARLGELGLEDRVTDSIDKMGEILRVSTDYDNSKLDEVIAEQRERSLAWLKDSIWSEKTYKRKSIFAREDMTLGK
jgi:hypothetical protein